jgi:hypothetical protein
MEIFADVTLLNIASQIFLANLLDSLSFQECLSFYIIAKF